MSNGRGPDDGLRRAGRTTAGAESAELSGPRLLEVSSTAPVRPDVCGLSGSASILGVVIIVLFVWIWGLR